MPPKKSSTSPSEKPIRAKKSAGAPKEDTTKAVIAPSEPKKKISSTSPAVSSETKDRPTTVISKPDGIVKPGPRKFGSIKPSATAVPVEKRDPSDSEIVATMTPAARAEFFAHQRQRLLELRDHILDQMQGVAQDSLRARAEGSEGSAFGMHQADAGSDAYEKDFALSLLSQEQDALYEIEEALKRIEAGQYGVCEMSGAPIPRLRLEAMPFARFTVECQAQFERENRGRRRWETSPQFMDASDAPSDEDDAEGIEDDDRKKDKD